VSDAEKDLRIVVYEGKDSRPLDPQSRVALIGALLDRGYGVTRVTDDGKVAPADGSSLLVLGSFTEKRPNDRIDGADSWVYFRDLQGLGSEEVIELAQELCERSQGSESKPWKPWFPVIDFDRCTNCMQCLSFCLFDVYGVSSAEKIQVQNHSNCKTDCPACSRVCPEVAILFPKYRSGPINGDEVSQDDLRREKMKVDISALLGGDIYQTLRDRSERAQSRFAKERDEERALRERKRCLAKLQKDLDIPDEVLRSLPSNQQIQQRLNRSRDRSESEGER
jgi:NAD-dependent dihydropyrimidine dehydrogenase PreA subunit